MTNSKSNRLATALSNGDELTARQIASRFNVANPHDLVYRLRDVGFKIEIKKTTNSKGQLMQRYALVNKRARKTKG